MPQPSHVLVALDLARADRARTFDAAVELACRQRGRLTLAGLVRGPSWTVDCGPVSFAPTRAQLDDELRTWAHRACLQLTREAPAEMPLDFRVLIGRPRRHVAELLDGDRFSSVVLARHLARRGWHEDWPAADFDICVA